MSNKRIGVIGGGQLAWMMADAAEKLGIEIFVQTPSDRDPAVSIATDVVLAKVDDVEATAKLANHCDVITFENEFVDLKALMLLAKTGVIFRPNLAALSPLLDKYEQRCYLKQIGIAVPEFTKARFSEGSATQSPEIQIENRFGFPVVLKVCRHGYDGQGTWIVKDRESLQAIYKRRGGTEILVEEFIPFERELAVMAARSVTGEIVVYPVVETKQKDQVCRWVIAPAEVSQEIQSQVKAIATQILEKLQVVGILGIELFLTGDGRILVNEIAPRTHNSGHYTLDASETSQFEQQLRAVTGLPLGSIALLSEGAVMVNLLGYENAFSDYPEKRDRLAAIPNACVHWYGKTESRPGRKLGHVTVLLSAEDLPKAQAIAQKIESIWYEK
ncbi:MAG: 5-(carboxyamino)imidazole ribonucleotide synthase [Xenococcaceae cyanobacterium]